MYVCMYVCMYERLNDDEEADDLITTIWFSSLEANSRQRRDGSIVAAYLHTYFNRLSAIFFCYLEIMVSGRRLVMQQIYVCEDVIYVGSLENVLYPGGGGSM